MSWENNVLKVVPYVPGEQPKETNMIKLNTNECPYPPSPKVEEALQNIKYEELRLYPDPEITGLTEKIAERFGVNKKQIFVGVGSDDVLAMAFLTFFQSDKPILFPNITYSFYEVWAALYGINYELCELTNDMKIKKESYYKENGGIIFPNPNAPTSIMEELETIEDILTHNRDVVVIVDEAYVDFGGTSAVELIKKYDNLLVVQTFSKSRSMAGMRIGYAIGNEKLIQYLQDAKFSFNSYTLNCPSQVAGLASLEDEEYFEKITHKIIATREWVSKELKQLGFRFPDSKANFLFITHDKCKASELYEALREAKIYVRYWNKPIVKDYLRVTVGTDEEMKKLIEFLTQYIENREKDND